MKKRLAVAGLTVPPIWAVLRRRALRHDPVTILCYHTLGPERGGIDGWTVVPEQEFRSQLSDLKSYYDLVGLDGINEERAAGSLPQAVITFDDGDQGLYNYLKPILREIPFPVTIYVATEQIETGTPFWFDRVVNALQAPGEIQVEGLGHWIIPAEPGKPRWAIIGQILAALKLADPRVREDLADQVAAQGRSPSGLALGPMSLDQLKELAATPGVTIGAHSHGHELLDQIPLEQARKSVGKSRELLREWTGQPVSHFAFPNGNHTAKLRDMVRDLGFSTATVLEERTAPRGTDPFALPRISVGRYDSRNRVRLRLVGF